MTVRIKLRPNGPYIIDLAEGGVSITDSSGQPLSLPDGTATIALCRCGQSQAKPFCDGTHTRAGFTSADHLPREAGDDAHMSAPRD